MPNAAQQPTYRRILVALSLDDDAVIAEVPKHGPVILISDPESHARLRALVLDPSIPHRRGEPKSAGLGDFVAEIGRQLSELGRDEGEAAPLPPDPKYRRIVVALTVDGDALLVEVPNRAPSVLRADRTFAKLRELVGDMSIASAPVSEQINPRQLMRGGIRAISELGKDDKPA